MKKNLLAVMAVVMGMASCTNENFMEVVEPGYGYIAVNVSNDPVVTRAAVSPEQLANWTITVTNGDSTYFNGAANGLASKAFAAGSYNLTAYNYANDESAHSVNDRWGDARYSGTVTGVEVSAGQTATPTIACGKAKNARISVVFNESFTTAVAPGYTLTTTCNDGRTLAFPPTNGERKAYYPADSDVTYTLNYTYKEVPKTVTGTIKTIAGTEHKLNVKLNSNGTISVSITYEDYTTSDNDITIDAITGEKVQ